MIKIKRTNIEIKPDTKRVLAAYLILPEKKRIKNIILRIAKLNKSEIEIALADVHKNYDYRHFDHKKVFLNHYKNVEAYISSSKKYSESQKLLLGAYLTKEYSIEAAALFNPSIVEHPDQTGLNQGELRFIISLRATGEGHISSIEFRSGTINNTGDISLDPICPKTMMGEIIRDQYFSKLFVQDRIAYYNAVSPDIFNNLPDKFSLKEAINVIKKLEKSQNRNLTKTKKALKDIFETNYDLHFDSKTPLSSRIIFPQTIAESKGMEDARFVKFINNGDIHYYGTYTAYDGKNVRSQLIETQDFVNFKIRRLYGNAVQDKGMALLPQKIDGKYVMIGRQGGEEISIMYSENIYLWDTYEVIHKPTKVWEIVQLGNSGSPIKTNKGWLLIIHGVGPVRKYVLSAILLDLNNPDKVIGKLDFPILEPTDKEREGYVPNVVYTCGVMAYNDNLIIPYAMSDIASSFAIMSIEEILSMFN